VLVDYKVAEVILLSKRSVHSVGYWQFVNKWPVGLDYPISNQYMLLAYDQ